MNAGHAGLSRFTIAAVVALLPCGCGGDSGNGPAADGGGNGPADAAADGSVDGQVAGDGAVDSGLPDGSAPTGLKLTFVDESQFILEFGGAVVYTDVLFPVQAGSPDPDLIVISHEHSDHFDRAVVADIANRTGAVVVAPAQAAAQLTGLLPPAQIMEMSPAAGERQGPAAIGTVAVTAYGESVISGHGWAHILEAGGLRVFAAGCSAWEDFVQLASNYPELYQAHVALLAWYDRTQFVQAVHPHVTVMMHMSGYCEVYEGESDTPILVNSNTSYEF